MAPNPDSQVLHVLSWLGIDDIDGVAGLGFRTGTIKWSKLNQDNRFQNSDGSCKGQSAEEPLS